MNFYVFPAKKIKMSLFQYTYFLFLVEIRLSYDNEQYNGRQWPRIKIHTIVYIYYFVVLVDSLHYKTAEYDL